MNSRVSASEAAGDIKHWQPYVTRSGVGIPPDAIVERQMLALDDITLNEHQAENASRSGAWWHKVHGNYDPSGAHRNYKALERQLSKDPSQLPPIFLIETAPGVLEIEDGLHRVSIAKHLGITHLDACVYSLELQAQHQSRPNLAAVTDHAPVAHETAASSVSDLAL